MISRTVLNELAASALKGELATSLYLNVDPKDNPREDWLLHFKNLARSELGKLSAEQRAAAGKDIERIDRFINDKPLERRRGMAVFSSVADDFWQVFHTAVPFNNTLVIEKGLFLRPLAAMIDQYQRYLVLVVGQTKARILITGMGEIVELTTMFKPLESGNPTRDGSDGDMRELRAQRAKDKMVRLLHKDIIAAAEKVMKQEKLERILIGGTDNGRGHIKEALPASLREAIVGEFAVDRNGNDKEILEKLMPVMKEVEQNFERRALDEVFNSTSRSVLGLSDVLTAIQQGNVHKIYIHSNTVSPGMVCSRCGALTPVRDRPCPYCGSAMEHVPYMLNLVMQKAIEQGARIDILDDAPRLFSAGGIAALLRY